MFAVLLLASWRVAAEETTILPERVGRWMAEDLTHSAVEEGVALLRDRLLLEPMRLLVLDRLESRRRTMTPDDLALLSAEVSTLAGDTSQPAILRARAVRAMAAIAVVRIERSGAPIGTDTEVAFFTRLARDLDELLPVRGSAIRALGIVRARAAAPLLRALLREPGAIDEREIARNACLALAMLGGDDSQNAIANVLSSTGDASIFGTAAFALGQFTNEAAVAALVENESRFPASGSPDAALVRLEPVILRMLQQPDEPNRRLAVRATRHLWKEGQRERYLPLLMALVADASLATRAEAVERILDDAQSLPLEEEQRQLAAIARSVSADAGLSEYAVRIDARLRAVPAPGGSDEGGRVRSLTGNLSGQEYGDAVYRKLEHSNWFFRNYNHTALFAGQASGTKRVIEADGSTFSDNTVDSSFYSSFLSYGSNYYGAYQLNNRTLTFSQRKAIMATGVQLLDASINWTGVGAIDPYTSTRPITISNIDNIRCDGVVEYAYEINGNQVWWHTSAPSHWNIANYPDDHNDAPDTTVNPDTEMSPWSQRGAPASSSEGPGYTGTNPNNTYLNRSAVTTVPTFSTSETHVSNTNITYSITARDESGIAYIAYSLPGSSWSQTSYGPQHPTTDSTTYAASLTTTGTLSYYAVDNGGNQTTTKSIGVYSISASAGSGGSISPSGTYLVMAGGSRLYTALPNTNYAVNQWLLNGSPVQAGGTTYTVSNVQANRTLQVTFSAVTRTIRLGGDLTFGNVTVGQTNTRTLTIYNDGNASLSVTSISYPSGFSGNWSSGQISPGSYQNVTVTFAPTAATSYGGTVTVNSDKTGGTNTTTCSGTGLSAPTRVIRLGGDLAFGGVTVGQTATRTLTIYNDGTATLTVSGISYPSGFSGNWSGGSINAGSSRNVTVTFAPSAASGYGGTISVSSDRTGGTSTISCSGTGVALNCLALSTVVNPPNGGSIAINTSPNCGSSGYNSGTPISLTANYAPGYTFSGWSGSGGSFSSQTANPTVFTITATASVTATFSSNSNPAPSLTTVTPPSVVSGGPAFTLVVDGINFIASSVVNWNGSARPTTYVSGTQLTASISATDIASQGSAAVTVVNPSPGGGTSNALPVTIQPPANQCATIVIAGCPYSITRALTSNCTSAHQGAGWYADVFSFSGTSGATVVIDMSASFDTVLYLIAPDGSVFDFNDDSNGTTNSQIITTLDATGTWTIEATTYDESVTGTYTLSYGGCGAPLATPTGVVVTYKHPLFETTPGVDVRWNGVSGAVSYEADVNGWEITLSAATSVGFYGLPEPTCYAIRIRAVGSAGQRSSWSTRDLATSVEFADDPLVARSSVVRAAHITDLRTAVATVRDAAGYGPWAFTDAIAAGVRIRALHIAELRAALNEALVALGLPAAGGANPIAGTTVIRSSDLQSLRDAMK